MNEKWPCIFTAEFTKEQVNPRLQEIGAPFGAFTRAWRWEHCATINPYGSDSCPYETEDCALAYLKTSQDAVADATVSVVGYFKILAKRRALDRVDNKPLARDNRRTYGLSTKVGATDLRTGAGTRSGDDVGQPRLRQPDLQPTKSPGVAGQQSVGMRSAAHRFQSLGDLLGSDGAGSHPRAPRGDEGKESTDNDGDTGDPVPPSSPRRLGDSPPARIEGVHSESE